VLAVACAENFLRRSRVVVSEPIVSLFELLLVARALRALIVEGE
jgi:hypothetical protein